MNRLLIHSNAPFVPTGYGAQCALFAERLKEHYDLAISAFYGLEGSAIPWNGIPVLPGIGGTYGNETIREHVRATFGDEDGLVLTLMDAWVLDPRIWQDLNVASWVPIDHDPAPDPVVEFFRGSGAVPIAMSRFGERMLSEAGLDPLYVPHAVDTSVYRPIDRTEARQAVGFPDDPFIVGMVAANKGNPSRKCFAEAFQAFKAFHASHKDARLYVHTEATGRFGGVDLPALIRHIGLDPDAVVFCDQYRAVHLPQPPEAMANVYSSLDVLLAPSAGEGFGIPVIEAQACFPAGTSVRAEGIEAAQSRPYTGKLYEIETARGSFEATADHPVWTSEGWRSAGSLRPADQLLFSHAPEGLDQVHAGAIEQVARGVQDDAIEGRGSLRWDDSWSGALSATESGLDAQRVLRSGRNEASRHGQVRTALLRWLDRWRGHRHGSSHESWEGQKSQLQALPLRVEHGQADDGLGHGSGTRGMDGYATPLAHRDSLLSGIRGGLGSTAALSSARAGLGYQERLDGGGHRVVRDSSLAIADGPLDEAAARNRAKDSGTEYEPIIAVRERDVRDLPVYNLTTRSGLYDVGPGYLVHNCGVPVIASDFSAQPELVGSGWLVDGVKTYTAIGSWQVLPSIPDITEALHSAYESRGKPEFAVKARDKALAYDVEKVLSDYMLPALSKAWERVSDRPAELVAA